MLGTIVKGISGFYYVAADDGSLVECKARGVFKKRGIVPLAGDKVEFSLLDGGKGVVEEILPRRNTFDRPPVANVEVMVVVSAVPDPAPNFGVIDRFCVSGEHAGAEIVLCVNKTDLASESDLASFRKRYAGIYPVCFVSGKTGAGLEELKKLLNGRQAALAGPSGAGKSTLTNLLLGEEKSRIGDISEKLLRGKNTTRHSELFPADGFSVFDTPGFTSFDVCDVPEEDLPECFPEFRPFLGKCRFNDCRHLSEPGCSVAEAISAGKIDPDRAASYKEILFEIRSQKKY